MERLLDSYTQPYNPRYPLLCFDEHPCYLIEQTLQPVAMKPGQVKRENYHYSVTTSCSILLAVEPFTGRRWAKLYDHRRRQEYTDFMQFLSEQFPQAKQLKLIQDNLNMHNPGSFYASLEPQAAFLLAQRFEIIYTPKYASWLNPVRFFRIRENCVIGG